MHITHLRELATTIAGLQHDDDDMIKHLDNEIRDLCRSALRDCCIEMANIKEDLEWATSTENYADILVTHRQISKEVSKLYKQMRFSSTKESINDSFLLLVPHLVQAIKEIFRDESIPQGQSGMRGMAEETLTNVASKIQNAAKNKDISRLFSEVSSILEILCVNNNNNQSRTTEDKIREWGSAVMIIRMLDFLETFFENAGSDAQRLRERLRVFSVYLKDIMSDRKAFEGIFLRDFHNVTLSLLKFAKFDPSQLVRFELNDPNNSSSNRGNDVLKYDKSKEIFSQLFWVNKTSEDDLQLEAVAHVHIDGHLRSIGAFESIITLPTSCSEVIDKLPIASMSIAVKREHDNLSQKLRVTLYATQKEKVRKALKYLEQELGDEVVDLKKENITQSHLKVRSFAKAGTVVRLRLIHKWGSETIALDSNDFVALADSTAGGGCLPDLETAG